MKQFSALCLSITAAFALANGAVQAAPLTGPATKNPAVNTSGRTVAPSNFEENKGQVLTTAGEAAPYVRYRLTQGSTSIFLLGNGIAYQFNRMHYPEGYEALERDAHLDPDKQKELDAMEKEIRLETYRMDVVLEGANADARITTEGRSDDYTQYYGYNALDVHAYNRVIYHEIYPGIDWVLHTTTKGLEYDFVLHPGAEPALIQLRFKDHEELYADTDGRLIHGNRMGRFTEAPPVSYQNGKVVDSRFTLDGDRLSFALGAYDHKRTLIIDPARIWGTYYGGESLEQAFSSVVDESSNVYLAGVTRSTDAIASEGYQNTYGGGYKDAFLVKFNSNGIRQWGTYYGGTGINEGNGCAVDGSGNVYLAGTTGYDTTIAYGGHQSIHGGNNDAFLVKFNATGQRMWGTFYGGPNADGGESCAVDANGNVYLSGWSYSDDVIAFGGHQDSREGICDAFLVKFDANGARQWGTYYGGVNSDYGNSCSVDGANNVFLAGTTGSGSSIAYGGQQQGYGGGSSDSFLVKFDPTGVRQWGTYCGDWGQDGASSCAVDGSGNVYIAGFTASSDSIAAGGHQNTFGGGGEDSFLAKYNGSGVRQWATYYGGTDSDYGTSCAVDANNNVYLAGTTTSYNSIASGGFQNTFGGILDAFLVKFNDSGVRQWGTYYGGTVSDYGYSCAVDGNGVVYLAGSTMSTAAIAYGGYQNSPGYDFDAFLVKLDAGFVDAIGSPQDQERSFSIWPNPTATDHFYMQAQGTGLAQVQLFDAQGKLQRTEQLQLLPGQAPVEVALGSELAKGLYMVRITVEGRSGVAPLVIE